MEGYWDKALAISGNGSSFFSAIGVSKFAATRLKIDTMAAIVNASFCLLLRATPAEAETDR